MKNSHWWWNVPEFVAAQRDPGFRSWVTAHELAMDLGEEPFEEIIPGLSIREPFTDEGINLAQDAFLRTFPDRQALNDDWHLMMRFVRYLGQAYVEKLECRWVWQPIVKSCWEISSPAIDRPWPTNTLFPLVPVMNGTVNFRGPGDWLWVFSNNRKLHAEWVDAGRPGFAEWKAHDQEIGAS